MLRKKLEMLLSLKTKMEIKILRTTVRFKYFVAYEICGVNTLIGYPTHEFVHLLTKIIFFTFSKGKNAFLLYFCSTFIKTCAFLHTDILKRKLCILKQRKEECVLWWITHFFVGIYL